MTTDDKIKLITRNLAETLTEDELKALIESATPLRHYIGFEISGKVHLGQGLGTMQKVKDLHDAGANTIIFMADWHSWINKKLDGTLETPTRLAKSYFQEAVKAAYLCVGGDPDDLEFVLGSELYDQTFWPKVVEVMKNTTISRMMRSTDITGRTAGESSETAILLYPAMQAADIFQMNLNIVHAGTDQRNVHVVAREVAKDLGFPKPIALHGHLLMGLKPLGENNQIDPNDLENADYEQKAELIASLKMSKSKPNTAVFITDSPEQIIAKLNSAYCPEGIVKYNPILDWCKHLIFYNPGSELHIERPEKWGGDLHYTSYEQLERDFVAKLLHPQDLKAAVADWLINKLEPARAHFEDPTRAAALAEIEQLSTKIV